MTARFAIVALAGMLASGLSYAGDRRADRREWNEDHPRRHEVNKRLNNQNRRIKEGVEDGKLSRGQAQQLHAEDRAIRQQEREDAAQHGGHITKGEQRQLNQEENANSRMIRDEKHPGSQ